MWLSLQSFYASGLQVRYVMVGILSRDSPGKAAAILEAPNPSLALDQNERSWARLADDTRLDASQPLRPTNQSIKECLHVSRLRLEE